MIQDVLRKIKEWYLKSGYHFFGDQNVLTDEMRSFEHWLKGLPEEIGFWYHYLQTRGGDHQDDFVFRLRLDTDICERDNTLATALLSLGRSEVRVLDVGSGPLTNLGKRLADIHVTIIPCDPLADVYGWLLDKCNIIPPIPSQFADVENLSMYFARDTFDAVHCANALDHSYNPIGGIFEMLKVVHPRGFVQIGCWENEAEREHYSGLHQWNFTERNHDLVMWNRRTEIALRELYGDALEIIVRRIPVVENVRDWILVQMRKTRNAEKLLTEYHTNLKEKYHFLSQILQKNASFDAIDAVDLPGKYRALLREFLRKQFDAIDSKKRWRRLCMPYRTRVKFRSSRVSSDV